MKIVRIEDMGTFCDVLLPSVYQGELLDGTAALDAALDEAFKIEYFDPDERQELSRRVLEPQMELTIVYDYHGESTITHTVRQWCQIFDSLVTEPTVLALSEY